MNLPAFLLVAAMPTGCADSKLGFMVWDLGFGFRGLGVQDCIYFEP